MLKANTAKNLRPVHFFRFEMRFTFMGLMKALIKAIN